MKWLQVFGNKNSKSNPVKYFCIGANKTGTTSLKILFKNLGFKVAPQSAGEKLIDDWGSGRFDRIINLAKDGYEFYQDIPFSLPGTYKVIDQNVNHCKFILTIRDDANEWYDSVIRFHQNLIKTNGIPTAEALKAFEYIQPGWMWKAQQLIYGVDETEPYNEEKLKSFYTEHCANVIDYFKDQPDRLLVLNLKNLDSAKALGTFINRKIDHIPWENKS